MATVYPRTGVGVPVSPPLGPGAPVCYETRGWQQQTVLTGAGQPKLAMLDAQ